MWVTKNINAEESIYRDYLNHIDEGKFRKARLAAWFDLPKKPFITENTHKLVRPHSTTTLTGIN